MNPTHTEPKVIYLAGGCFWGMEHLMQSIPGVVDACSGYANGTGAADANYPTVCTGETGFRETVQVTYDPAKVGLEALLLAFFYVIDPTLLNQQGNDRGTQYQTGIYYTSETDRRTVERVVLLECKHRFPFYVEVGPLQNFYPAESYHQDYLEKNPGGYCHIPLAEMQLFALLHVEAEAYTQPAAEVIRDALNTALSHALQAQEPPPARLQALWAQFGRGIYVDIRSGEALYSAAALYTDPCAGRTMVQPIGSLPPHADTSRVLRFVPLAQMETQGYGRLLSLFD